MHAVTVFLVVYDVHEWLEVLLYSILTCDLASLVVYFKSHFVMGIVLLAPR